MAPFVWILSVVCVAGCHQSSASLVLHPTQVSQVSQVSQASQAGQNVTLTCNLTSSMEITWYLLRSDRMLPLLTASQSRLGEGLVVFHSADRSRIRSRGEVEGGVVLLEIRQVEEQDAGLYFCSGTKSGNVYVNGGILLSVNGADGHSDRMKRPCWNLGICILPASFVLVLVLVLYLCSGKPAVCCCLTAQSSSCSFTEEVSLHYSSLKHRPRPSGQPSTGLVRADVIYSTVIGRRNLMASQQHR
ncbi:uncharacterized protein LOC115050767 [Echeneis naucrates]|uniref:uncharacterized protein LOC115050767 n=1 Tax=Echeneis naucrates TaxID=173247 RepID=UPI0011145A01|nr:uncharacterized protein LOC115050767 [Echeneis naucrates]